MFGGCEFCWGTTTSRLICILLWHADERAGHPARPALIG
jgi:hypothetical protein